jgi:hypothetical protein
MSLAGLTSVTITAAPMSGKQGISFVFVDCSSLTGNAGKTFDYGIP